MAGHGRHLSLPHVDFDEALARLGFSRARERPPRGVDLFVARPNRFLTYMVHAFQDGTALFTWEFAIAAYAATRGLQVGLGEDLNTFLYPRDHARGPQDAAWVAAQVERAEHALRSFSLVDVG